MNAHAQYSIPWLFIVVSQLFALSISSVHAESITVFELDAPHLSKSELSAQTLIFARILKGTGELEPVSSRRVARAIRQKRFRKKSLLKPTRSLFPVCNLTKRTKTYIAVSMSMKLGTDKKPAQLNGIFYQCVPRPRFQRFSLPFEGRLTKRVWRIFAEMMLEVMTSPQTEQPSTRLPPSSLSTAPFQSVPRSTSPQRRPPSRTKRPPLSSSPVSPPLRPSISPPTMAPPQTRRPQGMPPAPLSRLPTTMQPAPPRFASPKPRPPTPMMPPAPTATGRSMERPDTSSYLDQPRWQLWGGGRLYLRNFEYQTAANSPLLRGGISYQSGAVLGWGTRASLRPFGGNPQSRLGRLILSGGFESFRFTTLQALPDPFGIDDLRELPSVLNRWQGSMGYLHPFLASNRLHAFGLAFHYQGSQFLISSNPEYNGFQRHQVGLDLSASFTVIPSKLWLDLKLGFSPWAGLDAMIEELGAQASSVGVSAQMGFRYASTDGFSLGLLFDLDYLFSAIEGEGRGGRIGSSATDQMIIVSLEAGYSSL